MVVLALASLSQSLLFPVSSTLFDDWPVLTSMLLNFSIELSSSLVCSLLFALWIFVGLASLLTMALSLVSKFLSNAADNSLLFQLNSNWQTLNMLFGVSYAFSLDSDVAAGKTSDVYESFNLLVRRKPKENNFKVS